MKTRPTFSQRKGLAPIRTVLQKDELSLELRNTLWSVMFEYMSSKHGFLDTQFEIMGTAAGIRSFARHLWRDHFKKPIDEVPHDISKILGLIKKIVVSGEWHAAYDLLEYIAVIFDDVRFERTMNQVLESELSGYRFVEKTLIDITSEEEIATIEHALAQTKSDGVAEHIRTALQHLANKRNPDFRNSIKESISAVESAAKQVSGMKNATLGDALKTLESYGSLHKALKEAFLKLYGYTSDAQGIRHAMMEEPNLDVADAKFFLVTCSAFSNYLLSKAPTRTPTNAQGKRF